MIYTVEQYMSDMFQDNIENEEGELFLLFSLLYYMGGHYKKGKQDYGFSVLLEEKKDVIGFNWITPKGWYFKKTYTYLFFLFKKLNIKVDVDFSLEKIEDFYNITKAKENKKKFNKYETENPLIDRFVNKGETELFFEEPLFLYIKDDLLEWCEIKNNFDTDENIAKILEIIDEKISDFMNGKLEKEYGVLSFNKQKEILLEKLSSFNNIHGDYFEVKEDEFWIKGKKNDFSYIHFFIFLFRFDYISIDNFFPVEDIPIFDNKGNYVSENEKYSFYLYIKPKLNKLLKGWIELKELLLDKVFNEDYKQLTIKKKKGELHLLEGDLEFDRDKVKYIDLEKKFDNAEIKGGTYKGKGIPKYKVKEKIRLDKNN